MSAKKKNPVGSLVWFEIPADHPERARNFYGKLFGWKIKKFPGTADYWHIDTGGSGGKICMTRTAVPQMGYFAICQDTEGNAFGLWESDANAK